MEYDFTDLTWTQFLQIGQTKIVDRIRQQLYLQLHNRQFNKHTHQLIELEEKVDQLESNLRKIFT